MNREIRTTLWQNVECMHDELLHIFICCALQLSRNRLVEL